MEHFSLVILLLGLLGGWWEVLVVVSGNVNITSPPITDWGEWGPFELCPFAKRVQGFQLKTEPFQGPFTDDTAVNGMRLFCGDPFNETTPVISSSQGGLGIWGNVYSCYPGQVNGFQLRVEEYQGSGDDTATNNVRVFCSNFPDQSRFIEGDGMEYGEWGATQRCYSGQGVCGLRTQLENCTVASDCTALNNVLMECCD